MALLKQIAGHTGCARIKDYLERGERALAQDFLNLDGAANGIFKTIDDYHEGFDWARRMDATRIEAGNHRPHMGMRARTFKHFVISPSPEDHITLGQLRELSKAWVREEFPQFEVAITYHDDNERNIPHAHIVVNNTNMLTGYRMHTEDPRDLNRNLQHLAKERGLACMEDTPGKSQEGKAVLRRKPRSRQALHKSKAEIRIERDGGYSWLADIRNRVDIAKHLSTNEAEFGHFLADLGVGYSQSKSTLVRPDWVYHLIDEPHKRVSGEKLGLLYGRHEIEYFFRRTSASGFSPQNMSDLKTHATCAVEINDLEELDQLSRALNVCGRYQISSLEQIDLKISRLERMQGGQPGSLMRHRQSDLAELAQARDFLCSRNLLPKHSPVPTRTLSERTSSRTSRRGPVSAQPKASTSSQARTQARHTHAKPIERQR